MKEIIFLLIALFLLGSVAAQERKAELIITQESDLYHKPLAIRATNLSPHKRLRFELTAKDVKGPMKMLDITLEEEDKVVAFHFFHPKITQMAPQSKGGLRREMP